MSKWKMDTSDGIGRPCDPVPGVYVITAGKKPVYVGQSKNVQKRIDTHFFKSATSVLDGAVLIEWYGHAPAARFNAPLRYKWREIKTLSARLKVEKRLIAKLRPHFNTYGVCKP